MHGSWTAVRPQPTRRASAALSEARKRDTPTAADPLLRFWQLTQRGGSLLRRLPVSCLPSPVPYAILRQKPGAVLRKSLIGQGRPNAAQELLVEKEIVEGEQTRGHDLAGLIHVASVGGRVVTACPA